jgi:hypothetical protein
VALGFLTLRRHVLQTGHWRGSKPGELCGLLIEAFRKSRRMKTAALTGSVTFNLATWNLRSNLEWLSGVIRSLALLQLLEHGEKIDQAT